MGGSTRPPDRRRVRHRGSVSVSASRGIIGQWNTVPELKAHHVDYVIVNMSLVDQGYGLADPSFDTCLQRQGRLVFEANGATDISLRIYDVRSITGASR